jgi:hypothetical protein
MLLSFLDKSKICCINFTRSLPTDFRKLERLAALEPKVSGMGTKCFLQDLSC